MFDVPMLPGEDLPFEADHCDETLYALHELWGVYLPHLDHEISAWTEQIPPGLGLSRHDEYDDHKKSSFFMLGAVAPIR